MRNCMIFHWGDQSMALYVVLATLVLCLYIYWSCTRKIEMAVEMISKTVPYRIFNTYMTNKYTGYFLIINAFKDWNSRKIINTILKEGGIKKIRILVMDGYTAYKENPQLLNNLHLRSLPALIYVENGEVRESLYLLALKEDTLIGRVVNFLSERDENGKIISTSHRY